MFFYSEKKTLIYVFVWDKRDEDHRIQTKINNNDFFLNLDLTLRFCVQENKNIHFTKKIKTQILPVFYKKKEKK